VAETKGKMAFLPNWLPQPALFHSHLSESVLAKVKDLSVDKIREHSMYSSK
jgi:hypothetical protein